MEKVIINLLTYDGVDSWYCGVGTITKNFVDAIPLIADKLSIDLTFNVITPFTTQGCLGHKDGLKSLVNDICRSTGGRIIYHCDASNSISQFGSHTNWKASSVGAASILIDQALNGDSNLIISYAFDTPYCETAKLTLEQLAHSTSMRPKVIWVPHSTGLVHETKGVKKDVLRYNWEHDAVQFANTNENAFVAYINEFMKGHLKKEFSAIEEKLIPLVNGMTEKGIKHSPQAIQAVMEKYSINPDKKIVYATGRAEHYKGFDALIKGFAQTQHLHDADLVIFTSTLTAYAPCFDEMRTAFKKFRVRGRIIENFLPQEEMMAIIQSPNTTATVVPSRGEPFGLAPIEYWSWSNSKGPIIVSSRVGGLTEQIDHGTNGFLFNIEDISELGNILVTAITANDETRERFTQNGKKKVNEKYDYPSNIIESIEQIIKRDD